MGDVPTVVWVAEATLNADGRAEVVDGGPWIKVGEVGLGLLERRVLAVRLTSSAGTFTTAINTRDLLDDLIQRVDEALGRHCEGVFEVASPEADVQ
jgi:hypothetical protein